MRYLHEIFINCKLKKIQNMILFKHIDSCLQVVTGDERLLKDMICL